MSASGPDFKALAEAALHSARELLRSWYPAGKLRGREYIVGNLYGDPGDSLSINVETGQWSDFATGEAGGDLVSLYAAKSRISQSDAARALADGLSAPASHFQPLPKAKPAFLPIMPVPANAPPPPSTHPTRGKPEHIARVLDQSGDLLHLIYRFAATAESRKQITPCCFDGTAWIWKAPPAPRPLYGLPLDGRLPVLVVEGEKKRDAAAATLAGHYNVVSWPNGADGVSKADWSPLWGADVVVWPDADEAGLRAADGVCVALGTGVRIAAPPADTPPSWDVADAIAEGWHLNKILRHIARAQGRPQDMPPSEPDDPGYLASLEAAHAMSAQQYRDLEAREAGHAAPASPEARAVAGKGLLRVLQEGWEEASIPLRPWIARGYLMRRAVTVISGQGSAGKSSLMVAWSTCMALGSPFDRLRCDKPMRVGVYNVEDDEDEQKRRFSAMAQKLKVHPSQFMQRLAILGPARIGTLVQMDPTGRVLVSTPVMEALRDWIAKFKPDVLMLDPFVELHGQEENDNTAIRSVMAFLRGLAVEYDMSVIVLHHAKKGETSPGDPDSLRGASAIVGAARVVLTLNVMTEKEAEGFNIPPDRRRNYFRLDGAKSNYASIDQAEWFERQERRLANGTDDEPGDGVVLAWPWKPPSLFKDLTPDVIDLVLDEVNAGINGAFYSATRAGRDNSRWVGHVLMRAGCSEEHASRVASIWLRNGVLYRHTFRDPNTRKDREGVLADKVKVA